LGKRVLIVDDDRDSLYLLEVILKGGGWQAIKATNGAEALAKARREPPDLIVTDLLMPVMDGFSLCRACKADETLKHIPLVFYTAEYTKDRDRELALSLGAVQFIIKPQEPDILLQAFTEAMETGGMINPEAAGPLGPELEFFRQYNEVLFKKLEEKMLSLERENERLRHLEQELRRNEENYRQLFENAPSAIYQVNFRTGKFTKANDIVCDLFGCTQEEITSLSPLALMTDESKNLFAERLHKLSRGEQVPANPEYEIITSKGERRWAQLNSKYIYDEAGLLGADVVAHDVTDRKIMEERLQRAEKMEALGFLAGGVAHDMNNVLGVLVGYSELLLREVPAESRAAKYAGSILQGAERAAAIVQDLLTMARRGVTVTETVNLNRLVVEVVRTPEFSLLETRHPDITFRVELQEDLFNIKGSPIHLIKTILNLLTNAAESISGAGEVTITTENRYVDADLPGYENTREGEYVVLTVRDTGTGIAPADIGRIFEPFYTKKVMGRSGTGLGLAVVWGTVKDHGGYIDVRSTEDRGSAFTLYFPASREALPEKAAPRPPDAYRGRGETVLVVDDVEPQRLLAANILEDLNYRVITAASGEEAVAYLRENRADLLILDMIMEPGIDGLETYRRVLKLHPGQRAIIVTGFAKTDRVEEALRLGAGGYVKKPYVIGNLGSAVRRELDRGFPGTVVK